MKAIRTLLSLAWLALAVIVLVSTLTDVSARSWQPTWLAIGAAAVLLAFASAAFLFFQMRRLRVVAVASSILFLLYWAYLFLISPPDSLNQYAVTGVGVMLLCLATISMIVIGGRTSSTAQARGLQ